MAENGLARLRQFPKAFWVINGIELFERGAYYSLSAIFTVFMIASFQASGMGAAEAAARAGSFASILFLLLYLIPVLSASFSERVGYKTALVVVFVCLALGYGSALFSSRGLLVNDDGSFALNGSIAGQVALIVGAVGLIGLGAGIFKPIAASLVAQTSNESQRNFAFSIYYACINIGAFVFPLGTGIAAIFMPGRLPLIAFTTAAVLTTLNLVLTLFVFRNVRPPQKDVDVLRGLKTLGEVFRYPSFLVLMAIYAGFWFMYAMSLTFITAYMVQFSRMPDWFNVALLQSINPLVIIVATPLLGGITGRFNSLPLMITGIVMYALGLVTLGFGGPATLFIGGIILFSLGELLTHPSYLSYVSKIAPPGKESVFLGYGFIPVGVGLYFGSSIGGSLYGDLALTQGKPQLFWAVMASVGIVTAALLVVYNMFAGASRRAVAPGPTETRRRFPIAGAALALAVLLVAPALLGAASVLPGTRPSADAQTDDSPLGAASVGTIDLPEITGDAKTGEIAWSNVTLPDNATGQATLALSWRDEAPSSPAATNAPDRLKLHVTLANGTMVESEEVANPQGGEGKIELKVPATAGGVLQVGVEVVQAGASSVTAGPLGLPVVGGGPDAGNAYTVAIATQARA